MTELAYLATRKIGQFHEQRRNKLQDAVSGIPPADQQQEIAGNGASNSSPRSMNYQQMKLSVCYRSRPLE